MTLLIIFATIIFALVLERIIHCPILVGFTFFAAFLIVAAIFDSVALVIVAIALGILAFAVAFLDCVFRNINSNGRVVARVTGNNVTCNDNNGCGCNNSGVSLISENGNILTTTDNTTTNCGCGRNNRYCR